MLRLRVSSAALVLGTVLVAADAALLLHLEGKCRFLQMVALGVLPSFNSLVIGLMLVAHQLRERGECMPGLVGFEAAGWPALCCFVLLAFFHPGCVACYYDRVVAPFVVGLGPGKLENPSLVWRTLVEPTIVAALLALPQLALALLGGWVAIRRRIVISSRAGTNPVEQPDAV